MYENGNCATFTGAIIGISCMMRSDGRDCNATNLFLGTFDSKFTGIRCYTSLLLFYYLKILQSDTWLLLCLWCNVWPCKWGLLKKNRTKIRENERLEMSFRPASSENKMVAWVQSTAWTALPSTSRSSNGGLSSRPWSSFSLPPHSGSVPFLTHRFIEFVGQ